jgi:two-component system NarL family response regulator
MSQSGPLKLLIAEDRAALRRMIRTIVADLASEIRECAAGNELPKVYTAWQPDFVLIDADMRTMDGVTATLWIKAMDPTAKVIIVSSYDSPELRESAQRAGASAFIMKEDLLELGRLLAAPR